MFRREFEGGSAEEVLRELSLFQNTDGGFGNAMEPDFRLPMSSAIATSIGLQYISQLKLGVLPVIAVQAMQYLHATLDEASLHWDPVPPIVDEYPRATWWEYENWRENSVNPGVELAGYLWEFPGILPDNVREQLTDQAFRHLAAQEEILEMHDLLCYMRFAERLPAAMSADLYSQLDRHVEARVSRTREDFVEYGVRPEQLAPSPTSHYYPLLRELVEESLDVTIETQAGDGSWRPRWSWGRFPLEWERAQREWRGILTLNGLRVLAAYGRIET